MKGLVLSLFPGADLLGRAFEEQGFCVARGPDKLWGGDARSFHAIAGRFDGIIGGPPCQFASRAAQGSERKPANLIPEFLRIVDEARPRWAIMENVRAVTTLGAAPSWPSTDLCDADVGGHTVRVRRFWFFGIPPPLTGRPMPAAGDHRGAHLSVLASYGAKGAEFGPRLNKGNRRVRVHLTAAEAGRLQGWPLLGSAVEAAQPGGVSAASRRITAVHVLGNGVPRAMGVYLARHVERCLDAAKGAA